MKAFRGILWWCAFMAAAIVAQAFAPGLDMLTVGLIILLQERDYKNMAWLLPLFIFLQEGMGTRPFGAVIVWYTAVISLFLLGRWLFEASNFIFVFLLSACLGVAHYGVAWLMTSLLSLEFHAHATMDTSLMQAILIPIAWWLLMAIRRKAPHAQES